jgi:uncharacterized membrane protein
MRDRVTQIVLGVFVGIFAYCLVVLRTIRGGDEGAFVPVAGCAGRVDPCLCRHRLSDLFHSSHLGVHSGVEHYCHDRRRDHCGRGSPVSPRNWSDDDEGMAYLWTSLADQLWSAIPARKTGYIESIDADALLDVARKNKGLSCEWNTASASLSSRATPLLSVAKWSSVDDETTNKLNAAYMSAVSVRWKPMSRSASGRSWTSP